MKDNKTSHKNVKTPQEKIQINHTRVCGTTKMNNINNFTNHKNKNTLPYQDDCEE